MSMTCQADWRFRPLNPNENSGASTTDDNFADEERTSVEILVRETLQNPLDARRDNSTVVIVEYKLVELDVSESEFAQAIFSDNCVSHFRAGELIKKEIPPRMKFLTVEDFGTTGLEGHYDDSSHDGQTENWNAFWFREGEGAKPTKSNGGAGQGKITLYLASQLRSVFALTRRASDELELLFGCCRFRRNYKLPDDRSRWAKEARWGEQSNPQELATPIRGGTLLSKVKDELNLSRSSEAGTSFIVPMPDEAISERSLLEAVVNEFFFAICRKQLIVRIGNQELDSESITSIADALGASCRLPKIFRDFLAKTAGMTETSANAIAVDSWEKSAKLADSAFDSHELVKLKASFENSELVCVDFPVKVRRRPDETSMAMFRVFLQQEESLEKSQELFIRQDLSIDGEKKLRSLRTILPVMALTFIQDPKLSDLLVAAEEPTHRNWNAKRPKVLNAYFAPNDALHAVRNAALRLLQLISPTGKKDGMALASYFSDPTLDGTKKQGSGRRISQAPGDPPDDKPDIPESKPKPIAVSIRKDGFELRAKSVANVAFPLKCTVTLAYATAVGDPFKLWDAADFWLADHQSYPTEVSAITALTTDLNQLEFQMDNADSVLNISGFDPNRQLVIRVKFKEVSNDANNPHD